MVKRKRKENGNKRSTEDEYRTNMQQIATNTLKPLVTLCVMWVASCGFTQKECLEGFWPDQRKMHLKATASCLALCPQLGLTGGTGLRVHLSVPQFVLLRQQGCAHVQVCVR